MNSPKCPNCCSTNNHKHDTYCDDEHEEDNCFPFYCDDCGEGFEEDYLVEEEQ
jgi:hypothetical protein